MNITPPNPNAIIAALADIATAANSLVHCVGNTASAEHRTVLAQDLDELNAKLALLDTLPQLAPNECFTGPRRARGWLASFLVGDVMLTGAPILAETRSTSDQVNNTDDTLVFGKAAREIEREMLAHSDAELLESLRIMCGYVENGSEQTVRIFQDDATHEWHLRVGTDSQILRTKARTYIASSFHQVIRKAAEKEIPDEEPTMCEFCGMAFESPCETPPTGPCEQANNAFHGSDPTKPRVHLDVRPMDVQLDAALKKLHPAVVITPPLPTSEEGTTFISVPMPQKDKPQ